MTMNRRGFLRGVGAAGLCACSTPARRPQVQRMAVKVAPAAAKSDYLSLAGDAALFVQSQAVEDSRGLRWKKSPDAPSIELDMYYGSPGIVLFLLELYRATHNDLYMQQAKAAAAYLMATSDKNPTGELLGLYGQTTALVFVYLELFDATGDQRYRDAAQSMMAAINRAAPNQANTADVGAHDIVHGNAGVILGLLDARRRLGEQTAAGLAERLGNSLLSAAREGKGEGLQWAQHADDAEYLPNFANGTAGVAYSLARLYQETEDDRYLEAAVRGAKHLLAIANTDGDICLIPHVLPSSPGRYYLGWCQGPPGTSRLFHLLATLTNDPAWTTWFRKSANGVFYSGLLETPTPGLWDNVGQCCGSAAVAEFALSYYQLEKDSSALEFARAIATDIARRGTRHSSGGLEWTHAESHDEPYRRRSFTGYKQGAAGIGSLFVRLAGLESGKQFKIRLPDNHYPV